MDAAAGPAPPPPPHAMKMGECEQAAREQSAASTEADALDALDPSLVLIEDTTSSFSEGTGAPPGRASLTIDGLTAALTEAVPCHMPPMPPSAARSLEGSPCSQLDADGAVELDAETLRILGIGKCSSIDSVDDALRALDIHRGDQGGGGCDPMESFGGV
eukprot:TRINITY_DN103525_c0_g1_i1.p2 TRINITY_DN103525_c0_g1~~TRINITY_DN103525_c0_g1_i1.p2  ORF type:complete len:160 (+),score=34.01 TRINITY_DN103525_c0_g1_i1:141-620(+)